MFADADLAVVQLVAFQTVPLPQASVKIVVIRKAAALSHG
jgi:hypothetical protein